MASKRGVSSISPSLISQFLQDVPRANRILSERRAQQKKTKIANNNFELRFRSTDLDKFKTKSSALRYIRTTHKVVTGQYFIEQTRLYRQNLLSAFLKNVGGYDNLNQKISVQNIKNFEKYFTQDEYDMFNYIFFSARDKIEKVSQADKENLVRYLYGPEQYKAEHMERLYEIFNNTPQNGGVAEYQGEYDDYIKYRRSRGL